MNKTGESNMMMLLPMVRVSNDCVRLEKRPSYLRRFGVGEGDKGIIDEQNKRISYDEAVAYGAGE